MKRVFWVLSAVLLLLSAPALAGQQFDDSAQSYGPSGAQSPCSLWAPKFAQMQDALNRAHGNPAWATYGAALAARFMSFTNRIPQSLDTTAWLSPDKAHAAEALANAYLAKFQYVGHEEPLLAHDGFDVAQMNWQTACLLPVHVPNVYFSDGTVVTH